MAPQSGAPQPPPWQTQTGAWGAPSSPTVPLPGQPGAPRQPGAPGQPGGAPGYPTGAAGYPYGAPPPPPGYAPPAPGRGGPPRRGPGLLVFLVIAGAVVVVLIAGVSLAAGYFLHRVPNPPSESHFASTPVASESVSPSASASPSPLVSAVDATALAGTWTGGFYCNNEEITAAIGIVVDDDLIYAVVSFFPATGTTATTSGTEALTGTFSSGELSLRFHHWIKKPVRGTSFNVYSNQVTQSEIKGTIGASTCSDFYFSR